MGKGRKIRSTFNAKYFEEMERKTFGHSRGQKVFLIVEGNLLDGEELKKQRSKLRSFGLPATQKWVANKIGVNVVHYRRVEGGKVGVTLRILKELCRLFVCNADVLLGIRFGKDKFSYEKDEEGIEDV